MANTKSIDLEVSSSQYLSITDASQTGLNITGDMSIEMWVKLESDGIIQHFASKDNNGVSRSFGFLYPSDNKFQFLFIANGGAATIVNSTSANLLTVGTWAHIAAVVDVSIPSVSFYVDGSSVATTNILTSATDINDSTAPFIIGGRLSSGVADRMFDGLIDEVIIWDDIRTSTEISESYNSGDGKIYAGNEANMQGYWRLEGDLLDETSNDNDLTNNNSATYSTDVPFSGGTVTSSFIPQVSIF